MPRSKSILKSQGRDPVRNSPQGSAIAVGHATSTVIVRIAWLLTAKYPQPNRNLLEMEALGGTETSCRSIFEVPGMDSPRDLSLQGQPWLMPLCKPGCSRYAIPIVSWYKSKI